MQSSYTMLIANAAGGEEVVARGVALPHALMLALEHGGTGRPAIVYSDIGAMRYVAIGRRRGEADAFECATYTVIERSDDIGRATPTARWRSSSRSCCGIRTNSGAAAS